MYADDERAAEARLLDAVSAAASAGVDLIQIREHDLDGGRLLRLVRDAVSRVAGTPARVIVNDRVDIAMAAGAAGVHLRGDSMPAARVRTIAPSLTIGRSVHTEEEASAAASQGGCDYLLAGTLFPTPSKPEAHVLLGLQGLRRMCAAVPVPVLAVGGITRDRAAEVARTGAAGVAGIRLFSDPSSVAETVALLRCSFDR